MPRGGRYLTASEIGSFVYCPEAWYLQRFGVAPDEGALARLRAGGLAHQQIGRRTETLVGIDAVRRGLLLVVVLVAVLMVANSLGLNLNAAAVLR